jgi:uncharacterized membrane protein YphA (DoxX/SURF4 family)
MFRALARPLIASWFVYDGVQHAMDPQLRTVQAEPLLRPLLADTELDVSTQTIVRAHAIATVAAAAVLATSKTPRTAGMALTGLAALTFAVQPQFWRMPEGPAREVAQEDFVKNVALLGGAMLAASAGHTPGHQRRKKAKRVKARNKAKAAKLKAKESKSVQAKAERRFW